MADDFEEYEAQLRDSKFLHLLKPIRDLAENWNLDIARELDEYLTHLDRIGFSFDGGPSLDFAEAALLIQSSACVYSKKVEYLHTLVYQALEAVRTRRKKDVGGDADDAQGDMDGGAATQPMQKARNKRLVHDEDDSLEAFLASGLDLQEADDIDLEQDDEPGAAAAAVPTYNRPPAALLALEDSGGAAGGDGEAGVYRLALCHVHVSGALLLDLKDGELYDQQLRCLASRADSVWGRTAAEPSPAKRQQAAAGADAAAKEPRCKDDGDDEGGAANAGDDGDDEAAAAGGDGKADVRMADAAAAPKPVEGGEGAAEPPLGARALDRERAPEAAAAGGRAEEAGDRDRAATGGEGEAGPSPTTAFFDPYKPLDPNDSGTLPFRPLQVRKPGKVRKAACFAKQRSGGDALSGSRAAPAAIPGLFHQEFAYAAELMAAASAQQQPRAGAGALSLLRTQQHRGGLEGTGFGPDAVAAHDGWTDVAASGAAEAQRLGGPDVAAGGGGTADGEGEDEGGDAAGWGRGDTAFGDDDDEGDAARGFDASDVFAGMMGGPSIRRLQLTDGAAAGDEEGSYEELCRAHIDSMLAAAAAREVQTELALRVSSWRSRIDPVLKEEEVRHLFNLQQYGEKIIETLVQHGGGGKLVPGFSIRNQGMTALIEAAAHLCTQGQTASGQQAGSAPLQFVQVASSSLRFEVSRTFAAMLQLINNRNIAICQVGGPDAPFQLQLLTTVQPHKAMAEKMAGGRAKKAKGAVGSLQGQDEGSGARPEEDAEGGCDDAGRRGEEATALEDDEEEGTAAATDGLDDEDADGDESADRDVENEDGNVAKPASALPRRAGSKGGTATAAAAKQAAKGGAARASKKARNEA